MSDSVAAFVGVLMIGGLFAAYYMQRRRQRLDREAAAAPPAPPAPVATVPASPAERSRGAAGAEHGEGVATTGVESRPSSPAFTLSFVSTFLLWAAATHAGSWWGWFWQALYAGMLVLALTLTFGPAAFESARTYEPALTRRTHILLNGVPYVILPIVGWVVVIQIGSLWGLLAPGLIFVGLLAAGAALEFVESWRGPAR